MSLTAANAARIGVQLDKMLALADGTYVTIREGIATGKLTSLYYRPFETRKDSYGIVEEGQPGFFDIPKMLWESLDLPRSTWGA